MRAATSSPAREFAAKDGRAGLVRPARRSDAVPCLAIVREATMMRPRSIMTTTEELWSVREWRRRMLGQGERGITLVAEVAGTVAGLLGVARGDRRVVWHVAELGITVGAAYRGIGVGRALMLGCEDWARAGGVERLELGVYEHNEHARRLYDSMGYNVEGVERANVKFPEGAVSTVRMAKFL